MTLSLANVPQNIARAIFRTVASRPVEQACRVVLGGIGRINLVAPFHAAPCSCDPAGGCKKLQSGVWNVLDVTRQTYARCDARGCDTYDASFSPSGAFIVIDVPSRGMVAKVAADKSSFVEVATLGMMALNSFGICE